VELDPKRLIVLHEVAGAGGVAAAARALGHTPSAVSQQLRRLEQEAGVPLFARDGGGRLELTYAGRELAAAASAVAEAVARAGQRLDSALSRAEGPAVIGVTAWGAAEIGVPALRVLREAHPEIQPTLAELERAEGIAALCAGAADVLLITDDREEAVPLPEGVIARALGEDAYAIVVPEDWDPPSRPEELDGRPWIAGPTYSARGRAFARFARTHGITPSALHIARYFYAVQSLLAAGHGAALVPGSFATRLRRVRVTELQASGKLIMRVLMRSGPHGPSPVALAAAEAIEQAMLDSISEYARRGFTAQEPMWRRLTDPSERPAPD
jgi:DNA-binding transcriptional LysR family regulator